MPLLLLHGWPGSVSRVSRYHPAPEPIPNASVATRATPLPSWAPSLPGYGLSFRPGQKRFGVPEIADCVATLMDDVLGYARFGAQGGDWGAAVSSRLGYAHAERMIGIHINLMLAAGRDPSACFPAPTRKNSVISANWRNGYAKRPGISRSKAPGRRRLPSPSRFARRPGGMDC